MVITPEQHDEQNRQYVESTVLDPPEWTVETTLHEVIGDLGILQQWQEDRAGAMAVLRKSAQDQDELLAGFAEERRALPKVKHQRCITWLAEGRKHEKVQRTQAEAQ